ncbi:hypothetical protein [Sphingopyxis macrogoltabida]|uniref:Uncharacterized protein n=1 Tax=Sphingopyxis macrogoltabida TaxID=33050 RepID=A0AAC8Z1W7_SPHMC|nr:hypothetical protein [Sphingopyxis macrogoltabida]ALJ14083.1 hypothetical protein LH19_14510 [Sphingopyxis macrogoltabida]AMU90355.1 hypothetical protein ATM17_15115 [Sphingopyxis macrogoltabida]
MTKAADIISGAVYVAISRTGGPGSANAITGDILSALAANGFLIVGNAAVEGLNIDGPIPTDIKAVSQALATYDYADGSVEPCEPFAPMAGFLVEALRELGFAVIPKEQAQ